MRRETAATPGEAARPKSPDKGQSAADAALAPYRSPAQRLNVGGVGRWTALEHGRSRDENIRACRDSLFRRFGRDSAVDFQRDAAPRFYNAFAPRFNLLELTG